MSERSLLDASAVRRAGDGFAWDVPEGWAQGRGAWGGLVVAALVHAIEAAAAEDDADAGRRIRSVTGAICAPARVGSVAITGRAVRRGSGLSLWQADARDVDGDTVASLTAVLAAARGRVPETTTWGLARRPDVPPADEVGVVPVGPPLGPEFMTHMEFRPIEGLPVSGAAARTLGYARPQVQVPHTAASLLAMVDAWWPAVLPALIEFQPIATVTFAANLNVDPATVPADDRLLHHGWATTMADGYVSEQRHLWTTDGRLAVDNLQSIVLIA